MSLKDRIANDFVSALKSKDETSLNTLKMLKSAIKNKEIELIKELDEAEITKVIFSEIKKRKDSASQFESGGRQDLRDKENSEILVLEKYLPEMKSEDEIKKIICAIIEENNIPKNPSSFGTVMKIVMEKLNGQAEGSTIAGILKEQLK